MRIRSHRILKAAVLGVLLGSLMAGTATAHDSSGHHASVGRDLFRAAAATWRYHSLNAASAAGYGPFPEGAPLHECISSTDGTGAMGYHWLNAAYLGTDLDVTKPQVLVYAPDRRGHLDLVALEYVVFKADWDAAHPGTMPHLFGQMFMETGSPNRYDIPAFYALHVWLWKPNPSGLFAPFNPRVSCDPSAKGPHKATVTWTTALDVDVVVARASAPRFTCTIGRT